MGARHTAATAAKRGHNDRVHTANTASHGEHGGKRGKKFGVRSSEFGGVVEPGPISPEGHVHTAERQNHPPNTQRTQKRIHGTGA